MILAISPYGPEWNMLFKNETDCASYFKKDISIIKNKIEDGTIMSDAQGCFFLDTMEETDDNKLEENFGNSVCCRMGSRVVLLQKE